MGGTMPNIRVMIAENDPAQRELLSALLNKKDSIDIISIVSSRENALKQVTACPDIILFNPDVLKGYTLSRFINSVQIKSPRTRIIQHFQQPPSDERLISDIKKGVRGYFKSTDAPAVMMKAIHTVYDGELWAERRILGKAIANPLLLTETIQANVPGRPTLTNREREMLSLVIQGESNREIAAKSSISERTVKTHLYRVYRKLKVKSRTKAIALFAQSQT
jgi:DNA-binding NarL/FixJ family response regulator